MRELTFKGFLSQYVKDLSYADTLNMKKLMEEAVTSNYRLRAPLVLFAVETGKTGLMQEYLVDPEMLDDLALLSDGDLTAKLHTEDVPEPYRKVWNSYLIAKNAVNRDNALKDAMRLKILEMQKQNNCSNYRIYRDLNLNPGNINHWLKHGDSKKVSYQTAEKIMNYMMSR